ASLRRLRGEPYRAIQESDVLVVTSGTATLETALHEKPYVLVYRTAHLTYWLGRLLIRIPFLGIVNVLSGKPVSPELIQENCSARRLAQELELLMLSEEKRKAQIKEFKNVRALLTRGNSSEQAARAVLQALSAPCGMVSSKNT
ncbi:MAG: hypothetical protein HY586_07885, partial [Candidatus Omnitrophica bacterium]|nr:hypothetical protein [Candidatus Omnitrophota bacterium]